MSPTQKALFLDKKFGNFVLEDTEIYKPGPGEILIKIHATSLNPVDWKIQKLGVLEKYPAILGTDIAGEVEELGEGVSEFKVGDRVFIQGTYDNRGSSFQQYTTAVASSVARIPPNWTYDQVAALPVVLSCAYIGLYNKNPYGLGIDPPISEATEGKYADTPIVVLGGSTSVGQMVIQLAQLSGFSPIFTTASPKHTVFLKSLGATHILDRSLSSSDMRAEIKKICNDKPIHFVYDTVSSEDTQRTALDILDSGGQMVAVNPLKLTPSEDKKAFMVLGILRAPHNVELTETLYHDKISGWLERGLIKPNNVEILPNGLSGIPDGLARMQADQVSGTKLIAHPQET
ncbi:Zinc-type alcohol dehydrogenase-like protein C2E1P3.01 [Psilocybe cubensis]|uniref:Zinc-type alcohol dehydrogenase-like protein C2E1P3.01 n=2 Tax=Psilocybe cubensis TaxID=181762 RepID=A0ACB8H016_PSICU|nr:Zinc-type alcohol dehydrogenase-like protein C2E1P3.01 [Psilocybe cubensis]KAH9481171.1 Zinc-type alcohol dehydrogenase-like protein C2E1P3.01 [Psilocybe cubensis]